MKEYKKLAKNTFLIAVGNIGSKSIQFLMLPIFTKYLIPVDFGKLDVINTTISLAVPLLSLQIIEAVFRFSVEHRIKQQQTNVLSTSLLFTVFIFLFSLIFIPLLEYFDIFKEYNFYFYMIFILTVIQGIIKQYVRGLDKTILFVVIDILYTLIFVLCNIFLLVMLNYGVKAYLISTAVALLFSSIFGFFAAQLFKEICFFRIDFITLKELLTYSVPLIPNGIMWWIINASDRYILSSYLGYNATGIYSVAAKFPTLLTVISSIFFQAWQLSAMEEYNSQNYKKYFENVFMIFSSLMIVSSSLLFVFIKPFIAIYVNPLYSDSWRYIPFLFLGAVFNSFASFYGVNYTASKKTIGAFYTTVVAALIKTILMFLLIKKLGIQAASLSTFFAFLAMWFLRVLHIKRLEEINMNYDKVSIGIVILLIQTFLLLLYSKNYFYVYVIEAVLFLIVLVSQKKYLIKLFSLRNYVG